MVAKIKSGKSLIGALNYNENKVRAGKAKLIAAQFYGKDPARLSFNDKLFRLTDLAERNYRTKTNTVHLSLNFDPSENIEEDRLIAIADSYMNKIGFADQPHLIYKHFDAGHPHIHIVTTNIQPDGNRISLHNIGRLASEPARKEIEMDFGLIRADLKNKQCTQADLSMVTPMEYGATETKRAITSIVNEVIRQYKFTSLPEFNAVLKYYNIEADRGNKETVMFDKKGLRYWALDVRGKKIGVPIKASDLYNKPTLKLLEERYRLNEYLRKPFKDQIKAKVDTALKKAGSKKQFLNELKSLHIVALLRENTDGRIYGVTFIDHQNKIVFNGSDLGKGYGAAGILTRLQTPADVASSAPLYNKNELHEQLTANLQITGNSSGSLLNDLLSPADGNSNENLFERRKKKRRKKLKF